MKLSAAILRAFIDARFTYRFVMGFRKREGEGRRRRRTTTTTTRRRRRRRRGRAKGKDRGPRKEIS